MKNILSTLFLVLSTVPSFAQAPFSRLQFLIQGGQNINRTYLHDYWHRASGLKVSLATPFYAGHWEVGLGIHRFDASANVPGFGALWISSGWGFTIPVTDRIHLTPVLGAGNYQMSFDESGGGFSGENTESDFAGSLGLMASVYLSRNWFGFTQAEYLRIQTQPLMHLWLISVGIGRESDAGRLIKIFLE